VRILCSIVLSKPARSVSILQAELLPSRAIGCQTVSNDQLRRDWLIAQQTFAVRGQVVKQGPGADMDRDNIREFVAL
jgi:hypothetical protein